MPTFTYERQLEEPWRSDHSKLRELRIAEKLRNRTTGTNIPQLQQNLCGAVLIAGWGPLAKYLRSTKFPRIIISGRKLCNDIYVPKLIYFSKMNIKLGTLAF